MFDKLIFSRKGMLHVHEETLVNESTGLYPLCGPHVSRSKLRLPFLHEPSYTSILVPTLRKHFWEMILRTEFIKEKLMSCTLSKFWSRSAEGDNGTGQSPSAENPSISYPTKDASHDVFLYSSMHFISKHTGTAQKIGNINNMCLHVGQLR